MSATGKWQVTAETPMGPQTQELTIKVEGATFTGSAVGPEGTRTISGKADGNRLTWTGERKTPMPMTLEFDVTVTGDKLAGNVNAGAMGSFPLTGTRLA